MSVHPTKEAKPGRGRRFVARALLLLAVTLGVAWFLRERIVGFAVRRAARQAGIELSWTRFELYGLSRARIKDVTVRRAEDLDLAADLFEIEFDAYRLARADLGGLEALRVERLRGDCGPFRSADGPRTEARKTLRLPAAPPRLVLSVDALTFHSNGARSVEVAGLALEFDGRTARCSATSLSLVDPQQRIAYPLELRGTYAAGRFAIERATWDPRIVLEDFRVDLADAPAGLVPFEGAVRAFAGRARIQGRLDEGVVTATGVLSHLDASALARAYVPDLLPAAAGRVDVTWNARIALADPRSLEVSGCLVARDVRYPRVLDEVSGRFALGPRGISVVEGLVLHDDNAVAFELEGPPLDAGSCAWLDRTRIACAASLGDVRGLLAVDVGLALADGEPWTRAPVLVTARLSDRLVVGRVRAREADLGGIVGSFADARALRGRLDLELGVELSLDAPKHLEASGTIVAADVAWGEHTVDTLVTRAEWSARGLALEDLHATSGENRLHADFASLPLATLGPCREDHLNEAVLLGLDAELDDVPALISGRETTPALARLNAHRLVFEGALAGGVLDIERGEFETRAGAGRIERARVPLLGGVASILHDPALDLQLDLSFEDVGEVVAALAPEAFEAMEGPRGFVAGKARVRGHERGPSAEFDLHARNLTYRKARFDDIEVRAALGERSVSVERAVLRGSLGSAVVTGGYSFADRRVDDLRIDADLVDLASLAPGRLPSGAVRLTAQANGALDAVDGVVRLEGRDLSFQGARLDELAIDAQAVSGAWRIRTARARGYGVEVALSGRISTIDPSATSRILDLDALSVAIGDGQAALTEPAVLRLEADTWSIDRLHLEGSAGTARLDLAHAGGATRLDLALSIPLDPRALAQIGIESDGGTVEATIHAEARGGDIAGTTEGRLSTTAGAGRASTQASWKADLRDRRATIRELLFDRALDGRTVHASLTADVPLDPLGPERVPDGPFELHCELDASDVGLLPFARAAWGLSGGARVTADLGGVSSRVTGAIEARLTGARAAGIPSLSEFGRVSGSVRVALEDRLRLDEADVDVDGAVLLRAAGVVDARFDARALARGDVEGMARAPLDLALRIDADDLAPLASRVPTLRRTSGRIHADLRAAGTLAHPEFTGTGQLENGEIRTTSNVPSVMGVASRVHFDGEHLVVDEFTGELGGAPFSMQGRLDVAGLEPSADLQLKGASLLLWRESDVTLRADADLRLAGPLDALTLSGTLALRDGRYTKKFDFLSLGKRGPRSAGNRGLRLFSLDSPPFSSMRFDVDVTSATPFAIASNVVRGAVSPQLKLAGTGALPVLRGLVLVEPSRVLLPSGTLKVRSGRVEFRSDRPDVPELDIQASARLQGYDIDVNVSGSYDDPRVELSSVPPLPREDLALLLITGRPPGNSLSGAVGQRAAFDIAVYIARDVAMAWFEADEEDVDSLAERLEVVVGADTTKSGADAVLVRLRLAGDLDAHGRAIFATGERDVYDFYNLGLRFVFVFQ